MGILINSIYALLKHQAEKEPNNIALISSDIKFTYGDLFSCVNSFALKLKSLGVKRRDRVAIHLRKSISEVIATFSVASLGAVFVNINYQWKEIQLKHILSDCNIRHLVTDKQKKRVLKSMNNDSLLPIFLTYEGGIDKEEFLSVNEIKSTDFIPDYIPISNDLAALLYTSGSTGSPKGVMVDHGNLVNGARIVSSYLGLTSSDIILSVPPLNFDYGMNQLLNAVWMGSTLVLQPFPIPTEIVKTINQYEVTVLPLVAPSWSQLINLLYEITEKMPSLRIATNTGGQISGESLKKIDHLLPGVDFFLMYGLTESFRSTYLPPNLFQKKMGSIGKAIPDNEVFVIDPETGLCGPNEIGELVHRGCLVSKGYWGQPELTAKRIRPNIHLKHLIGNEAVVHSGDLVRKDEDGILWFEGRQDEMIKCSGFRVSPSEIEDIVLSIYGVKEAIAFGTPDELLGEVVHLSISAGIDDLNEQKVISYCKKVMPSYMVPVKIHLFQRDFPRTVNGKYDRKKIIQESVLLMEKNNN